ncbi:uncharacterized protein CELE_F28F8.9 [Caenorhabditis elegans]|uniref:Uncharacterized protein n=1 Tax=Caenorhabditis elegans TaxID=6239 RepID=D7SFP1_CAEEL|nr:Uncharacterized protein CELE_F28F8.9 [Caenorhabditis elegans]CBM41202.1 Uncharacterized protein CELE_F28F8.9 [Caenorhabditis elegans]|eukprot:NP_001256677.1 Uncharacterized protein CELE_F28F8.9 [Caenorhabditis elegans]
MEIDEFSCQLLKKMARYLLGATMYVEDVLRRDDWSLEETENVKKYFKNVKSFKIPKIEKRKAEEFDEPCRKRSICSAESRRRSSKMICRLASD